MRLVGIVDNSESVSTGVDILVAVNSIPDDIYVTLDFGFLS